MHLLAETQSDAVIWSAVALGAIGLLTAVLKAFQDGWNAKRADRLAKEIREENRQEAREARERDEAAKAVGIAAVKQAEAAKKEAVVASQKVDENTAQNTVIIAQNEKAQQSIDSIYGTTNGTLARTQEAWIAAIERQRTTDLQVAQLIADLAVAKAKVEENDVVTHQMLAHMERVVRHQEKNREATEANRAEIEKFLAQQRQQSPPAPGRG